jgi:O-antigen/teichoic acid export membrane protein
MMQATSTYWRHVLTVLGGALGAQALPLLAAPLITRLCTPAEMGAFSVWLGVVAVAAIGATLRMETAMILDHGPAPQQTCFGIVFDTASLTAIVVTLIAAIGRFAGWPIVGAMPWIGILTIGAGTWLTAMMQTTLAYATSHRAFGKAARAKVIGAGTIALGQLALLYAGGGGAGLLVGQLIGLAAGLFCARRLLEPPSLRPGTTMTPEGRAYLRRHRAFWRFSLPSNLLNALVSQLPLLMIGMRYGALSAGLFALTQRVLAAPISLLAASVLEVFKRQSVHDFQTLGNCAHAYRYTFKTLLLLGIGPSIVLFLFSPSLFAWIFGEAWRTAGELAQILAPLYFLNFIASPLSYVFFVAGKQKIELVWQVALFVMTVVVFVVPGTLQQSVLQYAIGYSGLYLVYLHMSYQCAQNHGAAT